MFYIFWLLSNREQEIKVFQSLYSLLITKPVINLCDFSKALQVESAKFVLYVFMSIVVTLYYTILAGAMGIELC